MFHVSSHRSWSRHTCMTRNQRLFCGPHWVITIFVLFGHCRYKEPPTDESDSISAYIRSVTNRKSSLSSADESSIKSAPAYNYYKPRNNSSTSAPQQLRGGVSQSQKELRNGDDIAQASNSLAQSLHRLAKGEGVLGMAMENVPKDEVS